MGFQIPFEGCPFTYGKMGDRLSLVFFLKSMAGSPWISTKLADKDTKVNNFGSQISRIKDKELHVLTNLKTSNRTPST